MAWTNWRHLHYLWGVIIEDCAVSPEDLPAYVSDIQKLLVEEGVHASYYAHAGAGELHIEPFVNLKTEEGKRTFRSILEKTSDLVLNPPDCHWRCWARRK